MSQEEQEPKKKFRTENFFGPKIVFDQIFDPSKTFFGLKIFQTKNNFQIQTFFRPKIFLETKIFSDPNFFSDPDFVLTQNQFQ